MSTDTRLICKAMYRLNIDGCRADISGNSRWLSVEYQLSECWSDGISVECWSICQPISYWLILDWHSWILNRLLLNMLAVYWSMLGQDAADILTQCWLTYQLIVMTSTTHSKHDPCELYLWRNSDFYSEFVLFVRDLLRYQTNMDDHDPEKCDDVNLWRNKTSKCYTHRPELTAPGAMVNYVYYKGPPEHLIIIY